MGDTLVTISRATWRDTWAVWKTMRACFEREAYDPLSILAMLVWPGDITLKAVHTGRLVGFIASDQPEHTTAWIIALGVHPDFRRQGIASRLLAECEARTTHPRLRLTVRTGNAGAIALYRRAGYVEVKRIARYYAGGEDGIEMEKGRSIASA
ncbi:MAG: GNAT family N-acetyltransferase [Thermoflexales bacterium]|nr:GNAT family N-acetyltransferase [Thermoflexales bacterium]